MSLRHHLTLVRGGSCRCAAPTPRLTAQFRVRAGLHAGGTLPPRCIATGARITRFEQRRSAASERRGPRGRRLHDRGRDGGRRRTPISDSVGHCERRTRRLPLGATGRASQRAARVTRVVQRIAGRQRPTRRGFVTRTISALAPEGHRLTVGAPAPLHQKQGRYSALSYGTLSLCA